MPIVKKKNENFFKTWSPEMAYTLGFFAADGAMTKGKRGNCYIEFTASDYPILEKFRDLIAPEHRISISHKENAGRCFRLQIGSKSMFADLMNLGFVPRKSKRLKLPKIPIEYFHHFVRGYFDGDGHVWFGASHKNRKTPGVQVHTVFTSGCKSFLECLRDQLLISDIRGKLYFLSGGYRLCYSVRASLSLYKFMYNNATLFLGRKKAKFEEYIKVRV